jgi:hypothetical protein
LCEDRGPARWGVSAKELQATCEAPPQPSRLTLRSSSPRCRRPWEGCRDRSPARPRQAMIPRRPWPLFRGLASGCGWADRGQLSDITLAAPTQASRGSGLLAAPLAASTSAAGWWAWEELNLRPHRYQLNAGNRCADRPFPRSPPTVRAQGKRSIGALVWFPHGVPTTLTIAAFESWLRCIPPTLRMRSLDLHTNTTG